MSLSASTPRLRLTHGLYAVALLAAALSDGAALAGGTGLAAQAAGFVLVAGATLWRLWASVFVAGRKDSELVTDGPYARCRHPLYFGSLVAGLGIGLTTRSVVITAVVAAVLAVTLWRAAAREDEWLAARHGAAWRQYRAQVPAWLPRLVRSPAPDFRAVQLRIYRKAFLDAGSMLGLWLLIVLVDALRTRGGWPLPLLLP